MNKSFPRIKTSKRSGIGPLQRAEVKGHWGEVTKSQSLCLFPSWGLPPCTVTSLSHNSFSVGMDCLLLALAAKAPKKNQKRPSEAFFSLADNSRVLSFPFHGRATEAWRSEVACPSSQS